ncbi:acyl-CoA dehydrogenase family protein [Streptomyces sp. NPDC102360]|uniref:acyl-CoA dehydrogenase family protein n=1 Tax=Streptomyces sp. NPDC102360 TaxID=3366160 RepID=UPI0038023BE2
MESVEQYGERARAWLAEHAPTTNIRDDIPASRAFQAAVYDAGFAGITWPSKWGGQGLTVEHQRAYNAEASAYQLPDEPFGIGWGMAGPVLMELGTEEQCRQYIRPLLRGEEIWCQLYSEPEAGSDVASLQSRAVREGDGWVVNGQKVWTSRAHFADRGILVARTDADLPKHRGLTMFVVDMHAPGVEVRPLRDMTGASHFNEVYVTDVRLPADAVVGTVNDGWSSAINMLKHERVSIGTRPRPRVNPLSAKSVAELAARSGRSQDPVVRGELARLYVAERAFETLQARLGEEGARGKDVGARGSVAKLAGTLLSRSAADLASRLAVGTAVGWDPADEQAQSLSAALNTVPSAGIAGGTNEIQRNIISERVLGLPKEPRADTNVPFRELKTGTSRA